MNSVVSRNVGYTQQVTCQLKVFVLWQCGGLDAMPLRIIMIVVVVLLKDNNK